MKGRKGRKRKEARKKTKERNITIICDHCFVFCKHLLKSDSLVTPDKPLKLESS